MSPPALSPLLASAISAVERMRAKKREKVAVASGFVAPVGEKSAGVPDKVLRLVGSVSYYGGREKVSTHPREDADRHR